MKLACSTPARRILAVLLLTVASACSSDATGTGGTAFAPTLAGTMNGSQFKAAIVRGTREGRTGDVLLTATLGADAPVAGRFRMWLYGISAPGTYQVGVDNTVIGASALMDSTGSVVWGTFADGIAGTVTISSIDIARITGTVTLTMQAFTGILPRPMVIQNARFDVPLVDGVVDAGAPVAKSRVGGSVDGLAYYAGHVGVSLDTAGHTLLFIADQPSTRVVVQLGGFTGAGTYQLGKVGNAPAARYVFMQELVGGSSWATLADGAGVVTVTSPSPGRLDATVQVTLQPFQGAATAVRLVNLSTSLAVRFSSP